MSTTINQKFEPFEIQLFYGDLSSIIWQVGRDEVLKIVPLTYRIVEVYLKTKMIKYYGLIYVIQYKETK